MESMIPSIFKLPCQGSNLETSDPESDVLPVTPQGNFCAAKLIISIAQSKHLLAFHSFSFHLTYHKRNFLL